MLLAKEVVLWHHGYLAMPQVWFALLMTHPQSDGALCASLDIWRRAAARPHCVRDVAPPLPGHA